MRPRPLAWQGFGNRVGLCIIAMGLNLIVALMLCRCGGLAWNTMLADAPAVRRAMIDSVKPGISSESQLRTEGSTGRRNTCIKTLCGSFVSQRLSRSLVELSCDNSQLCLAMYRQIRSFLKVLSQQAVSIFVCIAPIPVQSARSESGSTRGQTTAQSPHQTPALRA